MDFDKDGVTSEEEYFHNKQEQLAKLREVAAFENAAEAAAAAKKLHHHMCGKCSHPWTRPSSKALRLSGAPPVERFCWTPVNSRSWPEKTSPDSSQDCSVRASRSGAD